MKIFVFTVLLLAALIQRISARNIENEIDGFVSTCEIEHKVDDNDDWAIGNVTDKLNNKCFMKCFLVKSGLGNDKGEVFVDKVIETIQGLTQCVECQGPFPSNLAEILQDCQSAGTAVEPCEKVYQWTICAKEKIDKLMERIEKFKKEITNLNQTESEE